MIRVLIFAFCWLLLTANATLAKSWRGIVPLHSTRDDVRRLFGTPNRESEIFDDYELPQYTVQVLYACLSRKFNLTQGADFFGPALLFPAPCIRFCAA
jgi:hypothetical protein